jgi:hypothetical protein
MESREQQYLMLIKATPRVKSEPQQLVTWIGDIEKEYMEKFRHISMSMAHLAFRDAPWDFAVVFTGSQESVDFLTRQIHDKAPGQAELLTMKGIDLDVFKASGGRFPKGY